MVVVRAVFCQTYSVVVSVDANGLVVDEALIFPAVLVDEVHWVAGELHAAALLALAEVGVVLACSISRTVSSSMLGVVVSKKWVV